MSKKAILSLFILLSLPFLLFYSCNKSSPTTPEPPKKKAEIKISLAEDPIILTYNSLYEYWRNYWVEVIISETNGVGCRISIVKREFMYEGSPVWPETKQVDERISAFGSLSVYFDIWTYYEYEGVKITVEGGDDNGHPIKTSAEFSIIYYTPGNEGH